MFYAEKAGVNVDKSKTASKHIKKTTESVT